MGGHRLASASGHTIFGDHCARLGRTFHTWVWICMVEPDVHHLLEGTSDPNLRTNTVL